MLLNDLYTIDHLETGEGIIRANLRLNPAHPIFAGHFPGRPILPGACQLQLIGELLSHTTAKVCRLQQAGTIKFLTMIDPREHDTLQMTLHYGPHTNASPAPDALPPAPWVPQKWRVSAALTAGETVCLKFNGIFAAE